MREPRSDPEADEQFLEFLRQKFDLDYTAWRATDGKRTSAQAVCLDDYAPCQLCGGRIGPDVTGRLLCYGCGPENMRDDRVSMMFGIERRGVTWTKP